MCRMCGYHIDVISTSSHSLRDTSELSCFWTVELLLKILLLKREEMGKKMEGIMKRGYVGTNLTLSVQWRGDGFLKEQTKSHCPTSTLSSAPKQTSKTAHCHQFFFLLSDEKLTEKPKSPSHEI